jgi:hypothetical protein
MENSTISLAVTDFKRRLAWSLSEIANATDLSVNFLRSEARCGNLMTVKFGRRTLVRDEDLQSYIRNGSAGGRARDADIA